MAQSTDRVDNNPAKRARLDDDGDLPGKDSLSDADLARYRSDGYLVYRGLLSSEEVADVRQNLLKIIDNWYDEFERTGFEAEDWESVVNRDPAVKSGELVTDDR